PTNEVWVTHVSAHSPADAAGLRIADVLLSLNGQPVTTASQVNTTLLLRPDAATRLTLRRVGQEMSLTLTATNRAALVPGPALSPSQRAKLEELTRQWLQRGPTLSSRGLVPLPNAALQGAAQNNLGVILEAGDTLGPAIRAYGRAVYVDPQV